MRVLRSGVSTCLQSNKRLLPSTSSPTRRHTADQHFTLTRGLPHSGRFSYTRVRCQPRRHAMRNTPDAFLRPVNIGKRQATVIIQTPPEHRLSSFKFIFDTSICKIQLNAATAKSLLFFLQWVQVWSAGHFEQTFSLTFYAANLSKKWTTWSEIQLWMWSKPVLY